MPKTLSVAVIQADRNAMANLELPPIEAFAMVASQAKSLFGAERDKQDVQMIVAPEYFLNTRLLEKKGKAIDPKEPPPAVMSHSDKKDQYKTLEKVSAALADTILVAGTIFYKKGLFNRVGLNVCPVLQNGQIIYEYYKAMDDGSLKLNDSGAKFKTKSTSPIFKCSGITFAVEVCDDQDDTDAQLRNWQSKKHTGVCGRPCGHCGRCRFQAGLHPGAAGRLRHCHRPLGPANKGTVFRQRCLGAKLRKWREIQLDGIGAHDEVSGKAVAIEGKGRGHGTRGKG